MKVETLPGHEGATFPSRRVYVVVFALAALLGYLWRLGHEYVD